MARAREFSRTDCRSFIVTVALFLLFTYIYFAPRHRLPAHGQSVIVLLCITFVRNLKRYTRISYLSSECVRQLEPDTIIYKHLGRVHTALRRN